MIIKFKKTTETEKEIVFPYFTQSEHGTMYGHYTESECIMLGPYTNQIAVLKNEKGYEFPEIKQTEFEQTFNKVMTTILTITNNPL